MRSQRILYAAFHQTGVGRWFILLIFCSVLCGHLPAQSASEAAWPSNTVADLPPLNPNAQSQPLLPVNQPVWNTNYAAITNTASDAQYDDKLAMAKFLEKASQPKQAEPMLVSLLAESVPDKIKQEALLELAVVVHQEDDLPRAQSIYSQFIERWPTDSRVPEIYLHQGQIYRQMGLNSLALSKFYAVMTAALSLQNDNPGYYPSLVLEAQIEIAETHYMMGRYADAADFYARLLKQNHPALNRPQAQFRLIRSLKAIDRNQEAVTQAEDFLVHYPNAPEQPEVRFYLAQALKQLGKNNESLQQVLLLLKEQKEKTLDHPEVWAYWQQRAGNEIANQLYQEGDYVRALEVYLNLAQLDSAPGWQLPVDYQIGLTYEKLMQPQKAVDTYRNILKHEAELGTNATPGQKAMFSMARWRADFLGWREKAEQSAEAVAKIGAESAIPDTNAPAIANTP